MTRCGDAKRQRGAEAGADPALWDVSCNLKDNLGLDRERRDGTARPQYGIPGSQTGLCSRLRRAQTSHQPVVGRPHLPASLWKAGGLPRLPRLSLVFEAEDRQGAVRDRALFTRVLGRHPLHLKAAGDSHVKEGGRWKAAAVGRGETRTELPMRPSPAAWSSGEESAGREPTQPPAKNSCGSNLFWSDSNASLSGD